MMLIQVITEDWFWKHLQNCQTRKDLIILLFTDNSKPYNSVFEVIKSKFKPRFWQIMAC